MSRARHVAAVTRDAVPAWRMALRSLLPLLAVTASAYRAALAGKPYAPVAITPPPAPVERDPLLIDLRPMRDAFKGFGSILQDALGPHLRDMAYRAHGVTPTGPYPEQHLAAVTQLHKANRTAALSLRLDVRHARTQANATVDVAIADLRRRLGLPDPQNGARHLQVDPRLAIGS